MNIQQATKLALDTNQYISREGSLFDKYVRLQPTNTDGGYLIIAVNQHAKQGKAKGMINTPGKRWQPYAEDLIADDWYVTGLN